MHNHIRYQLEILDSSENIAKSLKSLSSEKLAVKLREVDKGRIIFHMLRRDGAFQLNIDGEILRGKANTCQLSYTGQVQIPPLKMGLQRGLVLALALLSLLCAIQLAFWFLPLPLGLVDSILFVSGTVALLLGIGTVAWLADFFLVRRTMTQERLKCQTELRLLLEAIFARVQPAVMDYRLDETETMPA